MKPAEKKDLACAPAPKPEQSSVHTKQTSGDKAFDEAIDRMLKKPAVFAPAK